MKHTYLLSALMTLFATGALAQTQVGVDIDLVYQDDGSVAGYPAGYNTWRIYAVMESQDDFLSAIYATSDAPSLTINTSTGNIWNAALGHTSAAAINSAAVTTSPVVAYDSWITVGDENSDDQAFVTYLATLPSMSVFDETFGTTGATDQINGNLSVEDGAWFTLLDASNGYPDEDGRVLIAQVTTDGDIAVCMNFQIFPGGINGELTEYDNYCDTQSAPGDVSVSETHISPATILPNPTAGNAELLLDPTINQALIEVRNLAGQIVWQGNSASQRTTLPLESMSAGVYLVNVTDRDSDHRETLRLVVR